MTRKDYELIAGALKQASQYCETQNQRRGVERSARCIGSVLQSDNPRFDRERFLKACGVE